MSQAIVQVENLNLSYKGLHAVQNVSFSVNSGEILAVIGQNGSGKTSTVECIEGLHGNEQRNAKRQPAVQYQQE